MFWQSSSKSAERANFTYKGVQIKAIKNDITNEKSDCIVNAANEHLAHGAGVAGAISSRGGPEVQRESTEYVRKHGIVHTGQVAVTGPGRLSCKKIIHAVGPVFRNGRSGEDEELESAIMNSFKAANDLGYSSISIPAISSGIFGYPKPRCAKLMIRTARNFIDSVQGTNYSLAEIRLTNFDEETTALMEQELEKFKENPNQDISLGDVPKKQGWGYGFDSYTGWDKSPNVVSSSWGPLSNKSNIGSVTDKLGQSEISRKFDDEKAEKPGSQTKLENETVEQTDLMEIDKIEELKTEELSSQKSSLSKSKLPVEVHPDIPADFQEAKEKENLSRRDDRRERHFEGEENKSSAEVQEDKKSHLIKGREIKEEEAKSDIISDKEKAEEIPEKSSKL